MRRPLSGNSFLELDLAAPLAACAGAAWNSSGL